MKVLLPFLLLLAFLAPPLAAADAPTAKDDLLATLRPGHPRLILTPQRLAELQAAVKTDPAYQKLLADLEARGRKMLKADPIEHKLIGPRLLDQSRKCVSEVTTCALLYRLTGEKAFADRAIATMTTAAAFKDWNPSHFLDTAEMTNGMGLGYDWLYDTLTPDQRKAIRDAIVANGLRVGQDAYAGKDGYLGWWTKATHNWSQVCNGGLAVGALAIADEEPELSASILRSGLHAVQGAFAHWETDGGWDEGPGYWGYTTSYTAYYMAALQSALGTMHDLEKTPGLDNAGLFRLHFTGPTGKTFNFADAGDGAGSAPQMFFLSHLYNRPEYAWHHRQERLDSPLDLIWFDPRGDGPKAAKLPPSRLFHGVDVVLLRSAWEDPQALWAGIKGGNNKANHSHLDLGTFVLEAAGQRWFIDLGSDDYNMPGYFGAQRWTYYRLMTQGHNTLLINSANQPPTAKSHVLAFEAAPGADSTVIDLTPAYPMTTRTQRGLRFLPNDRGVPQGFLLQDEIEATEPVEVISHFHTPAAVKIEEGGHGALLTLGDQTLRVAIINAGDLIAGGAPAKLSASSVVLDPPQKPLKGITRLTVSFPAKVTRASIQLIIEPANRASTLELPKSTPLAQWPGMAKPAPQSP